MPKRANPDIANRGVQPLHQVLHVRGITHQQAADVLGVQRSMVTNLLIGNTTPTLPTAARFARLVNLPIEACWSPGNLGLPQ